MPNEHEGQMRDGESYMEWASRQTKRERERTALTWEDVQSQVAKRDWTDMHGCSVRDVLGSFANTDRCVYQSEYDDAPKFHAEEIIAALAAAGFEIVPKRAPTDAG